MSAVSADPAEAMANSVRKPLPVLARAAAAKLAARRRPPRRHGPVGLFLLSAASVISGYSSWWTLCLLHGPARVLTAGGISTGYLIGSALWRRGWLG
ncbi:hypothetical protein [Catenulispora pinisilvae]|uniref:hypothetical protein n=1 Tax=Catenulispora pinisilvae TaxID=2705253 RepID=UPI0018926A0B|nr:hypothetical protein [Catenulispora pinisilvae]